MDSKQEINEILILNTIEQNKEKIIALIPELKPMIGFEHKHPHHHLDVWSHTISVVINLKNADLETKLAGLLHDIGKPFSYQDEEIRHFHGHPQVSAQISRKVLLRLGYDTNFINNVCYLIKMHDTAINPKELDNSLNMVLKLLQLQYADARSHHPDKIQKRITFLDTIKKELFKLILNEQETDTIMLG